MGGNMDDESNEVIRGLVKWYNKDKGYGFIQLPGGGLDIFVHANQLRKSGIDTALNEGERLSFTIDKGPKGAFATNIKKVDGSGS